MCLRPVREKGRKGAGRKIGSEEGKKGGQERGPRERPVWERERKGAKEGSNLFEIHCFQSSVVYIVV